jgi:Protein of unknown function (DUF1264)
MTLRLTFAPVLALVAACGGENTDSKVSAPGEKESAETKVLEAGADAMQAQAPLRSLNAYLDGFHFYNGNMQAQMEAHHYCGHLNEEVIQCVIFDGNKEDAKIMGIEYIVSRKLFEGLPADEKRLWHSHVHEVRSGQLVAPGIPEVAEHELMKKLAGTYGKTWHTWSTDQKLELPLGIPMLMMGFTQDGQANEQLVVKRDERFGISSAAKRERRANIEYPAIDPGADAWSKGVVVQLQVEELSPQRSEHPSH